MFILPNKIRWFIVSMESSLRSNSIGCLPPAWPVVDTALAIEIRRSTQIKTYGRGSLALSWLDLDAHKTRCCKISYIE
jgi:hypothetical protein